MLCFSKQGIALSREKGEITIAIQKKLQESEMRKNTRATTGASFLFLRVGIFPQYSLREMLEDVL